NEYTYPPELKDEIQEKFGDYIFDVEFRTDKKKELSENLFKMAENHFNTIKYMIRNKPWDLFWFVEIGLDRVNHGFWHFADNNHKKYQKGSEYEDFIKDFYIFIDKKIGELLKLIDKETIVLMVSDHGAKAMKGCFCVNEWLINNNYITLNSRPPPGTRFEDADINWSKTKAWGWGGYYARIFLNVKEREEFGIIDMKDYEKERDILIEKIKNIKDPSGNPMKNNVFKVEDIFPEQEGDPPDLMVYFDDLSWRSAGTIGYDSPYLKETDIGPDEAVHDYFGIFAMYDPKKKVGKNISEVNILDIAPTILNFFNVRIPEEMEGRVIRLEG
ncbi:MAG: alkaline phosphatase family protein, partial [Candidatus Helarchaeota archaeon]|nr:alkaline phosphatase family protein [Candidatus Helarchaeota archaeon]